MENKFSKKTVPLILCDTTLRDGLRTPYFNPTLDEKIAIFTTLEASDVDIIEVGYVINGETDFELLKAIKPKNISQTHTVLCHANEIDIQLAATILEHLPKPRLHLYLCVGTLQLPYQESLETAYLIEQAMEMVALASALCDDVQLTLMDATQCPLPKLISIAKSAIKYGLGTLCIADTTGCATPMSMSQLLNALSGALNFEFTHLGVHCHNDNDLANAIALMAHQCGVAQIEGTIGGIGERKGNVNLVEIMRKHHKNSQILEPLEQNYLTLIKENCADTRNITY